MRALGVVHHHLPLSFLFSLYLVLLTEVLRRVTPVFGAFKLRYASIFETNCFFLLFREVIFKHLYRDDKGEKHYWAASENLAGKGQCYNDVLYQLESAGPRYMRMQRLFTFKNGGQTYDMVYPIFYLWINN